jgi:hypothetical protein
MFGEAPHKHTSATKMPEHCFGARTLAEPEETCAPYDPNARLSQHYVKSFDRVGACLRCFGKPRLVGERLPSDPDRHAAHGPRAQRIPDCRGICGAGQPKSEAESCQAVGLPEGPQDE